MLARDPNAYVIRAAGPCPTRPAMPNHVTNTTCTASQANGESPASQLPTHPRSAASTRPAPPRSTTHASSLVPPAGLPAGLPAAHPAARQGKMSTTFGPSARGDIYKAMLEQLILKEIGESDTQFPYARM